MRWHRTRIFSESTGLWGPSIDRRGTIKITQISINASRYIYIYYRNCIIGTIGCGRFIMNVRCHVLLSFIPYFTVCLKHCSNSLFLSLTTSRCSQCRDVTRSIHHISFIPPCKVSRLGIPLLGALCVRSRRSGHFRGNISVGSAFPGFVWW